MRSWNLSTCTSIDAINPDVLPGGLCDEKGLQTAVCIGWTFEHPVFFKATTSQLIHTGSEDFNAAELRLPAAIASKSSRDLGTVHTMQLKLTFSLNPGAINRHRNELLTAIFNKVIQTRNQYIKSHIVKCTVACDAMVLGSLTIALRELKLSAGGPAPESSRMCQQTSLLGGLMHCISRHSTIPMAERKTASWSKSKEAHMARLTAQLRTSSTERSKEFSTRKRALICSDTRDTGSRISDEVAQKIQTMRMQIWISRFLFQDVYAKVCQGMGDPVCTDGITILLNSKSE